MEPFSRHFGAQHFIEQQERLAGMVFMQAVVTEVETRRNPPTSRHVSHWIHVSFQDMLGKQVLAAYSHGLPVLFPSEGDTIEVGYDPANPQAIVGMSFLTTWGGYIVGALIVLLSAWMGCGLLINEIRNRFRRGPSQS